MYTPIKDGIEKVIESVEYIQEKPPRDLAELVQCFWELKTTKILEDDFHLHAIPDACVNIMFNEIDVNVAGVTGLRTTYEVLNLGKSFHYIGIQLLPGVWHGNRDEVIGHYIDTPYSGSLPLIKSNRSMKNLSFKDRQIVMIQLVRSLANERIIASNDVVKIILTNLDDIRTVADMADVALMSPRHLQRVLKQTTGFTPHDLLKVLRLQHAFKLDYSILYADQAHFIRSFQMITGYTPKQYFSKFNV